ncbi:SIR2 family protein [Sphingomonas sp. S2-65]|uniref:SIR2 family protein n=1 Tax=Sphingomonas sp. S2-65 TaxID=2903960 RepID=UPI001F450357|nr:SIR2 family protein [Sphingomonas sp. S2-65]UYY57362.1 SIR2 family protein [Sphingomonas sp. S2-65]
MDEIEAGRCVVFAGAGVSTETRGAHAFSFYEQIAQLSPATGNETFPALMDLFENRPNGRQKLIEQIKARFDYINGFRDLRQNATRFHRSLSIAPYFRVIITTNWDRYFEDVLHATPFVYDEDLALWEGSKRPLIKIHGSIDNLSTIVASTPDYLECEERLKSGRLGDILRHIFATKTVVFFGYSATDSDFLSVYGAVRESMGRFARAHYLVSPFITDIDLDKLANLAIKPIATDGSHFVEVVAEHMRAKFCYAYEQSYDIISEKLANVTQVHREFVDSYAVADEPHLIFATAYQDGLIHCLQRIVDRRFAGDFADLHHVRRQISLYQDKIEQYQRRRDYWNSSYFVGYQTGLLFFDFVNAGLDPAQDINPELLDLPLFYHPKLDRMDKETYGTEVRGHPEVHKASLKQAARFAKKFEDSDGIVAQHTPFG